MSARRGPEAPPVRVALVGAGLIGRTHLAALGRSPRCAPCAVVDPSPGAAGVAAAAGVPHLDSLEALLAGERPDGVILATPNRLHLEQTLACLERGLAVLVEKPLAASVAEGERLVRAVRAGGGRVLVGHHRTHGSILRAARELIADGALGRLVAVSGSATFYKPDDYFDAGPWRRERGAGPILINLIHEVHSLRLLCGEIVAVQAFASNAVRGFAVEDTAAINLRFASGALGTFLLSDTAASPRSWEQSSGENPAYAHHGDEDCYLVAGTRGSLAVPTMRLHRYAREADRSWWKPFEESVVPVERDDPIERQLEHFVDVIRGAAEPLVDVASALANLRVTEAVAEAAATGGTVAIGQGR